ncbi:unnamed protein product [Brassica rapa subsp. trilocularis]
MRLCLVSLCRRRSKMGRKNVVHVDPSPRWIKPISYMKPLWLYGV